MKFSILFLVLSVMFAGTAPAQTIRLKKVAPKSGLQTEFSTKAAKRRELKSTLDRRPRMHQREASRLERLAAMPDRKAEPLPAFEHNFERETPAHARLYDQPVAKAQRQRPSRPSPAQRAAERSRQLQRQQALAAYPTGPDESRETDDSGSGRPLRKTSRGTPVYIRSQTEATPLANDKLESRSTMTTSASEVLEPKSDSDLFYAHGTESARTLRPWQLSYARVAGIDSFEGTFVLNSVNVGVTDYLQVGVNPLLYGLANTYNFSAKLNFYNSQSLAFALGYSHLTMQNVLGGLTVHSNGLSVISNYFIDERWSASYLVQASHGYGSLDGFEFEKVTQPSHFADVQYRIHSNWISTSGLSYTPGRMKDNPTYSADRMMMGIGTSMTWKIPKSWFFMYPAAGIHYYPELNNQTFLFSVYLQ